MSLNHEIADLLGRMAAIMEIKGEVVFKSIAFSRASRVIKDLAVDIKAALEDGSLADMQGIGKSVLRIVEEYIKTGRSTDYDELAASVPAGLLPLLQIPGLGPKTISLFWKQRGVTSLEQLVLALENKSLDGLKGIGEKKLASIKQGIEFLSQSKGRLGIGETLPVAQAMLDAMRQCPKALEVQLAGSLRRCRETIGDVDLLCGVKDAADALEVGQAFVSLAGVQRVLGQGPTKCSVLTAGGLQVDLRIVPMQHFGAAWLYFTGSKDHNVRLRGLAQQRELTLNEWGLYRLSEYDKSEKKIGAAPAVKPVASRTEADVYAKLDLPFIEPELREDRGEIDAAANGTLPKLVTLNDIRGDLHSHTTASDGVATIEQMAQAAMERGYEYLAITDHSKSQVIANGLTAERLLKHVKEIRKVADRLKGIHLLAGCEVDILVDGTLDFEDAVLAELDIVVASPHVSLKQDTAKATERILRALENRYVNIIGHPTGRLINTREGLPLDFARLFKVAAANGTAMEINAGYPRLDLNDVNAHAAMLAGVKLSIDTDAHSTGGLAEMRYGLGVARRAWARSSDVINCMKFQELKALLRRKR